MSIAATVSSPLRFGFADAVLPISGTNAANGKVDGILPASIELLSQTAGINISMIAWPWNRTQQMFEDGAVDALCTTETNKRREIALFCREPLTLMSQVIVHRRNDRRFDNIRTMEQLLSFRHVNYRSNGWAQEALPADRAIWVLSPQNAFKVVAAGHADVFINDEVFTRHQMNSQGLTDSLTFSRTDALKEVKFKICIRKDLDEALIFADAYDRAILSKREALQTLKEDWIAGRYD
ncbi:transporter substrate-binding domain-containing protein [Rhodospirillaceae bacterium KN72]|uniref:Transporter substrate-binding domain-containing protein n=1 Tax=Pacificispira spongiicola TaxID=2729598 RepID=A0A7Y0E032_9PROT|nr:transporter substrate-binding domain-containing protein [Pacificispira spongiicola]NMM44775.1 transporter substrate-binding domain-containing protein [Pacificispira spongiicola]